MERDLASREQNSSTAISVETFLNVLHPKQRTGIIFDQSTPIEIQMQQTPEGKEYSLLIEEPIRKSALRKILEDSSDQEFSQQTAVSYLRDDVDEFGGRAKEYLHTLGQLLELPDDSGFLSDLLRSFNSHPNAWKGTVNSQSFAHLLIRDFNTYSARYFNTAEYVADLIMSRRSPVADTQGGSLNRRMAIERFGKLPAPQREAIITAEMEQFGDEKKDEEVRRIKDTFGINFTVEHEGEEWYLTGKWDEIIGRYPGHTYTVKKGDSQAMIRHSDEGFTIYPYSAFLVPTISWRIDRNGKSLIVPSRFDKSIVEKKVKGKPEVTLSYPLSEGHKSNSVVGLTVLQYILDYPPLVGIPPEYIPELALFRRRELLKSDFIKKAEELVGKKAA